MYRLTNTDSIIRIADGACIPADPDNTDYQRFLKDQADGVEIEPYTPPPPPVLSPIEQIRALEEANAEPQAMLTRQVLLEVTLDTACARPEAAGLTRPQVHAALMAKNSGYAKLFNLEQQIAALRAQL